MARHQKNRATVAAGEVTAIDLFCGAGGLTKGFEMAGLKVVAGFDVDPASRYPYEANTSARFVQADVAAMNPDEIREAFGHAKVTVLAGCAPCQPFSTYARARRSGGRDWQLLRSFAALVRDVVPDIVAMENVPQLRDHPVFAEFTATLSELGYQFWHDDVECMRYGIPQTRKRLTLLASRFGPIRLMPPTHPEGHELKVRNTIGHLDPIPAGGASAADPLHRSSRLSEINLRRIRASSPGGTWRDWNEELRAECHSRDSGATYPSVYGRMAWEDPAPTITTQCFGFGNGRFGHPEQDRAISLREAALLQTFPPDYEFVEPGATIRFAVVGRMIGNAVPVRLAEVVARSILDHAAAHGI